MKGITIVFKGHELPFNQIFISGNSFEEVEEKLKQRFELYANERNDTVDYFNWLTIDSDFVRDYDAEISIHYRDKNDPPETNVRSYSYQFDFTVINETL